MHYYIDGYNLMFRLLRAGDDLARQREQVIEEIYRKVSFIGLDVTIVFDSQYNPSESTRSNLRAMAIHFTDHAETADEYILSELKSDDNPFSHTVVTSDKKLAYLARLRSAKTISVEDFMVVLNKRFRNKMRQKRHPLPKAEIKLPVKPKTPTVSDRAEDCFDFYLQEFESEFEEILKKEPPPKESKPVKVKKKSKKPKKAKADSESLLETWTKAFERNLSEDKDDLLE
jgi:predicted RNA-binding protein with PIN domain